MHEATEADRAEPWFVGRVDEQVVAARAPVHFVLLGVEHHADLEAQLRDLRFGHDLALFSVVDAADDGRASKSNTDSEGSCAHAVLTTW